MRSVTRSLTTALTVAAVLFVPTVLGRGVVAGQGTASPASSSMNDRARFVSVQLLHVSTKVIGDDKNVLFIGQESGTRILQIAGFDGARFAGPDWQ